MKHQLSFAQNQILNFYTSTLFKPINVNVHAKFLSHETLLKMFLIIRKFQKNSSLIFQVLISNTPFCFNDSTAVPTTQEGSSPIPSNVDPTAYDIIMLEVKELLPSPLTSLVLPPPVSETVYEMQTPALFTMAQFSPQPQPVDTENFASVNPLPSPATSSWSSGELHLYINSDTSSPSIATGPTSSSQELLLQGSIQVTQPLHSSLLHTQKWLNHNQHPSLQAFLLGLTKWQQRSSLAAQHQKQLSQIGLTLVGFVDHDHDHSHWFTHRQ